jgi:acetylornithine deacetylase/succinyl-diaminopimelate desuccinylase-like protein
MGPGAAEILLAPTVNFGTIHGGFKVNVIPEKCVFEAEIRLPIGLLAEEVMNHISAILKSFPEASMSKQEAASNPANYCRVDHLLAKSIANVTEDLTERRPVLLAGLDGTDCKSYRSLGILAFVIGTSPFSMGASGESVDIKSSRL